MWLQLSLAYVAAAPDVASQLEAHQKSIAAKLSPAVAFVASDDAFGSGFFIRADGLLLTNRHVVPQDEVTLALYDGRHVKGRVIERADDFDLALVQAEIKGVATLEMSTAHDLEVGDWVASVGHGKGATWTFNTGLVSNLHANGREQPVFQTQIPLNPGNSGGPVVNRLGQVVGVVTSGITGANSINFAIKMDQAFRSLKGLEPFCRCLLVQAPVNTAVFFDGTMVGVGPRLVLQPTTGQHEVRAIVGGVMQKHSVTYPRVSRLNLR